MVSQPLGLLRAATFCSSAWKLPLPPLPTPNSPLPSLTALASGSPAWVLSNQLVCTRSHIPRDPVCQLGRSHQAWRAWMGPAVVGPWQTHPLCPAPGELGQPRAVRSPTEGCSHRPSLPGNRANPPSPSKPHATLQSPLLSRHAEAHLSCRPSFLKRKPMVRRLRVGEVERTQAR